MMISAVLSNLNHPDYGVVTIPFPIPRDQYDYGRQRLQETLELDDDGIAELEGFMDFEKHGQLCMENGGVVTTEFGRLRRLEPPFSEQTQEMRMQGFR